MEVKRINNPILYGSILIVCIVFSIQIAIASTEIAGNIIENTEWTKANSPYIITSTLQIWGEATLTIAPGVIVKINPDTDIIAEGAIVAVGLDSMPIVFTSAAPDKQWHGITLLNNNSTVFEKCIFENAINLMNLKGSSTPIISNDIFRDNSYVFVDWDGYQKMEIYNNQFKNNYSCFSGIRTSGDSFFKYNNFIGNEHVFEYGYYFGNTEISYNNFIDNGFVLKAPAEGYGYGTIIVPNNWWSTTDESCVDNLITDKFDDVSLQIINYLPIAISIIPDIGPSISDIEPIVPGDIDNDGIISLKDAIGILKICSGNSLNYLIYKKTDLNSDGKLGIEEEIYVLQTIAEQR